MAERPILFSSEMVRAILDGRKTQTRRIVKPQPPEGATEVFYWDEPTLSGKVKAEAGCYFYTSGGLNFNGVCPYGSVGDLLWVRETWGMTDGKWLLSHPNKWGGCPKGNRLVYKADGKQYPLHNDHIGGNYKYHWCSARFMPKWAARLWLEITNIRVERIQDIKLDDILAEGISLKGHPSPMFDNFLFAFRDLWDSLNAKRGYSWTANPFVWVIEFKRIKR